MIVKGARFRLFPLRFQHKKSDEPDEYCYTLLCFLFRAGADSEAHEECSHVRIDNNMEERDIAREPTQDKKDGLYGGLELPRTEDYISARV
jgi:hypothetical protein